MQKSQSGSGAQVGFQGQGQGRVQIQIRSGLVALEVGLTLIGLPVALDLGIPNFRGWGL